METTGDGKKKKGPKPTIPLAEQKALVDKYCHFATVENDSVAKREEFLKANDSDLPVTTFNKYLKTHAEGYVSKRNPRKPKIVGGGILSQLKSLAEENSDLRALVDELAEKVEKLEKAVY